MRKIGCSLLGGFGGCALLVPARAVTREFPENEKRMGGQTMFYLRLLGGINLALTVYRVITFQWGHGTQRHLLNQCGRTRLAPIGKVLCMVYNTSRSFKILWGIRTFFTLLLFVKRIQSSKTCYGFWFLSTVAELCIKVYLVQNGGMDPPGIIQFFIELGMVYILTALLAEPKHRRRQLRKPTLIPV